LGGKRPVKPGSNFENLNNCDMENIHSIMQANRMVMGGQVIENFDMRLPSLICSRLLPDFFLKA
jgi:hypothetical protein